MGSSHKQVVPNDAGTKPVQEQVASAYWMDKGWLRILPTSARIAVIYPIGNRIVSIP